MSGIYYSNTNLNIEDVQLMQENDFYNYMVNSMVNKLVPFVNENATIEIKDLENYTTDYTLTVAILSVEDYNRLKEIERIFYKYTDLKTLLPKE